MEKRLALIFGGEGAERRVSERSAASVLSYPECSENVLKIGIDRDGSWYLFDGSPEAIKDGTWKEDESKLTAVFPARLRGKSGFVTEDGELIEADLAFPLLHGDMGEDGNIQGALRTAKIAYIGSSASASALTIDKAYTKIIAEYLGIPTVPWFVPSQPDMRKTRSEAEKRLGYPIFIKPRQLGSSIGAFPVRSRSEFKAAYESAMELGSGLIMIEALADVSRELEFALFDGKKRLISSAGVIHSSGNFYSYAAKYEGDGTPKITTREKLPPALVRRARSYARQLSDFLSLGNVSRIDFFVSNSGELFFNEINSIPGMTDDSLYPRLTEDARGAKSGFLEELVYFAKPQ